MLPVAVYQDVLDPALLRAVQAAAAAYLDGPPVPDSMSRRTLCSTHWVPLQEESAAHHAIEQAAALLFALILRGDSLLSPDQAADLVGGEWWLQEQGGDDFPKEFHTDQDLYVVESADGSICSSSSHPTLSSVLYLGDVGGATAVFSQRRRAADEASGCSALVPEEPARAVLSFPRKNQLLVFRGDLLHGVMHPMLPPRGVPPTDDAPRLTLLINFWSRRPSGAHAPHPPLPPPHPIAGGSGELGKDARAGMGGPRLVEIVEIVCGVSFDSDASFWREQRVPPAVESTLLSHGTHPPLVINYAPMARPTNGTYPLAGTASARFWFDCRDRDAE